mgnify:CR=1 FL=1
MMPTALADYGVAIFSIGIVAWMVITVFAPRRKDPDLSRIISDNTRALTELSALIEQQGQMIQAQGQALRELANLFNELRLEVARKVG